MGYKQMLTALAGTRLADFFHNQNNVRAHRAVQLYQLRWDKIPFLAEKRQLHTSMSTQASWSRTASAALL